MQLMRRLRHDESGAALVTALLATMIMLALGLAVLAIVDTQANESTSEQTRDRAFNLSESVLTSEAFILGRSWPETAPSPDPSCNSSLTSFGDTIGSSAAPSTATARLRPNLNVSYTDAAYTGATWQVNICDDVEGSTVWDDSLLANKSWDSNPQADGTFGNGKLWVRAQSTVAGKTRAVVGLVKVRETAALDAKYGLVSGSITEDLGPTTAALTNNSLVTALTNGLINSNPPVLQDAAYPVPASGVTGLRCGLLDNVDQVKTCVTGAIGALSSVPAVNTLVTQDRFEQFPTSESTSQNAIGQMRTKAKATPGAYIATSNGGTLAAAPACAPTSGGGLPASSPNTVLFIEKVGTGDQYCVIDVSTSRTYKAVVIGSGRVIIRGSNSITDYSVATSNRLTAVVYALNLQTADHAANVNNPTINPTREVVRIDRGARVTGAVHADGKTAQVNIVAPDFNSTALINGLLCPGALCGLAGTVTGLLATTGLNGVLDGLINGCIGLQTWLGCVGVNTAAAGISLNDVVGGITSQLSTYGSAIHSDVATINALTVYGASGVTPGTFRDLQPR